MTTTSGDCTIVEVGEAPNVFEGSYPGEMRFLGRHMETDQVALTYRRMPAETGGKGSYGHRHKTQEEIYLVLSGRLEFKLGDEVVELGPHTAVKVPPHVYRSVWNARPEDAELLIVSTTIDDVEADVELMENFWPETE